MNIRPISVTLETSHSEMSWLKLSASSNISLISVTFETSQSEISQLKLNGELGCTEENNPDMSVINEVPQVLISP